MSSSLTDEFASSLEAVDVSVTRTTTGEFATKLSDIVSIPVVAVELPFSGVTLTGSELDVTVDPTPEELRAAATGITPASLGITNYGSVVIRCTGDGAEFLALYPERHVAVVAASDVVTNMPDAIDAVADPMRDESADFVIATGPSATADMGAVVQGVHGPSDVHVVILEDR